MKIGPGWLSQAAISKGRSDQAIFNDRELMMITVILLVIVGGISLSQAVSDPHQVTLRWLRLGGIIAVALLAVAVTIAVLTESKIQPTDWGLVALTATALAIQLTATQKAKHQIQRRAAGCGFLLASGAAGTIVTPKTTALVTFHLAIHTS